MAISEDTNSTAPSQPNPSTDIEDIIPVTLFVPVSHTHTAVHHTKPSFIDRMKDLKNNGPVLEQSLKNDKAGKSRIVYMPRGDCLRYFAKDKDGDYAGTEPERTWTNEELDLAFGMYQPAQEKNSGGKIPDSMMKGLATHEG